MDIKPKRTKTSWLFRSARKQKPLKPSISAMWPINTKGYSEEIRGLRIQRKNGGFSVK